MPFAVLSSANTFEQSFLLQLANNEFHAIFCYVTKCIAASTLVPFGLFLKYIKTFFWVVSNSFGVAISLFWIVPEVFWVAISPFG